jgi:hypothetical protein
MAMRTFLQYVSQEDMAYHAEKQEIFDYWDKKKAQQQIVLEKAVQDGLDPNDIVPHPDDIQLNWTNLDVDLTGPIDQQEKDEQDRRLKLRDLSFELSSYYNEGACLPDSKRENATVGLFILTYIRIEDTLPVRLRCDLDKLGRDILKRATMQRSSWEEYLQEKCKEVDLPFFAMGKNDPSPFSFPLEKLGFEFYQNKLRPATPQMKRKLKRLMAH